MVSKHDLALVLEHYGITISPKHGWQTCKCIIHDDTRASAAYNLDEQLYHCLVCQLMLDVYDLIKTKEGIEFADAKRKAEAITHGQRYEIRQLSHSGGSLLPTGTRHKSGSRKYIPSWKRRGA